MITARNFTLFYISKLCGMLMLACVKDIIEHNFFAMELYSNIEWLKWHSVMVILSFKSIYDLSQIQKVIDKHSIEFVPLLTYFILFFTHFYFITQSIKKKSINLIFISFPFFLLISVFFFFLPLTLMRYLRWM